MIDADLLESGPGKKMHMLKNSGIFTMSGGKGVFLAGRGNGILTSSPWVNSG
jgi:hypothetical protein